MTACLGIRDGTAESIHGRGVLISLTLMDIPSLLFSFLLFCLLQLCVQSEQRIVRVLFLVWKIKLS